MKQTFWKCVGLALLFVTGVQAGWATVSGNEVEVLRTTVQGVPESTTGKFDITRPDALVWSSGQHTIVMPYKTMTDFRYANRLARHLGVLPAIGAGLVRKRERKHFFTLAWKDDKDVAQVLEVEVSKEAPRGLLEVLRTRAPQACSGAYGPDCGIDRSSGQE